MLKLSSLKIDPEFSAQILPLSFEELQQLEQNIIAEGRLLNPIITWNGYILDGHTRYRILKKHGFILHLHFTDCCFSCCCSQNKVDDSPTAPDNKAVLTFRRLNQCTKFFLRVNVLDGFLCLYHLDFERCYFVLLHTPVKEHFHRTDIVVDAVCSHSDIR